jgi:hypothetical protein
MRMMRMREKDRGRERVRGAASQMSAPLALVAVYAVSKLADLDGWIPASWDARDSALSVLLFAAAVLLVARRQIQLARYASDLELADRASARGEATLPSVRALERRVREAEARVDMLEYRAEISDEVVCAIGRTADVPEADNPLLRLAYSRSGGPVA